MDKFLVPMAILLAECVTLQLPAFEECDSLRGRINHAAFTKPPEFASASVRFCVRIICGSLRRLVLIFHFLLPARPILPSFKTFDYYFLFLYADPPGLCLYLIAIFVTGTLKLT